MHSRYIKVKIKHFRSFFFVQNSRNAYPSHSKPLHTKHIDNTDMIIANFSEKSFSGWARMTTILNNNWKHTDEGNHNSL